MKQKRLRTTAVDAAAATQTRGTLTYLHSSTHVDITSRCSLDTHTHGVKIEERERERE